MKMTTEMNMNQKQNELASSACMRIAEQMIKDSIDRIEIFQNGSQGLREAVRFRAIDKNGDKSRFLFNPDSPLHKAVCAYIGLREPFVGATFHDAGGLLTATIKKEVGDGQRYEIKESLCFFEKGLVPEFVSKYKATTLADLAIELHQKTKENDELIDHLLESLSRINPGAEIKMEVSSSKTEGHARFITDEQQQLHPADWAELYEVFNALAKEAFPKYANEDNALDGGIVALRAKKNAGNVVEVEFSNWNLDLRVINQRESEFNHQYVTPARMLKPRTTPYLG